jgi:PleD family two-component response regulator
MQHPHLCKIPVIMMSAKDDKDIVTSCLAIGAKDFIVKPLRSRECKGLQNYIITPKIPEHLEIEKNLSQFETIRMLGRGAAG